MTDAVSRSPPPAQPGQQVDRGRGGTEVGVMEYGPPAHDWKYVSRPMRL